MDDESSTRPTPLSVLASLAEQWHSYEGDDDYERTAEDDMLRDFMCGLGRTIKSTVTGAGLSLDAVAIFNIVLGMELIRDVPNIAQMFNATCGAEVVDERAIHAVLLGALASQATIFFSEGAD